MVARKITMDEMQMLMNPGYLFRFREKRSSKLAMDKSHFILVLFASLVLVVLLDVFTSLGWISFV